jgi:hypothetical protein
MISIASLSTAVPSAWGLLISPEPCPCSLTCGTPWDCGTHRLHPHGTSAEGKEVFSLWANLPSSSFAFAPGNHDQLASRCRTCFNLDAYAKRAAKAKAKREKAG